METQEQVTLRKSAGEWTVAPPKEIMVSFVFKMERDSITILVDAATRERIANDWRHELTATCYPCLSINDRRETTIMVRFSDILYVR